MTTNEFGMRMPRQAYYAAVPNIYLSTDGYILDFNLATIALCGSMVNRWRNKPFDSVFRIIENKKSSGKNREVSLLQDTHTNDLCEIHTDDFGIVRLWIAEIPEGLSTGETLVHLVPEEIDELAYRSALMKLWEHALIWELYARSYDSVLTHLSFYCAAVDRHVAAMTYPDVKRVLDVGAGTGNVSVRLARQGLDVTAVDLSRTMLEILAAKPESRNIAVVEANAEHLDCFADGSFDGVSILLTLFDTTKPERVLNEVVRVLRRGGRIVITEPRKSFNMQILFDTAERELRALPEWTQLAKDWSNVLMANRKINPERRALLRAESILKCLEGLGFTELQMVDSHLGTCATLTGRSPSA